MQMHPYLSSSLSSCAVLCIGLWDCGTCAQGSAGHIERHAGARDVDVGRLSAWFSRPSPRRQRAFAT